MKIIRTILFILNLLLAVGLVLTTLAGAVAPSSMMLPSLLAYGYLPLLAANVAMALVWLLMRRWEFLLPVAAIALRWGMVGGYLQVGGRSSVPPREEHPAMVTLMSYNVHLFQGDGQHPSLPDDNANGFLALVRQHGPDVLCLQEYVEPSRVSLTDSLALLGYNHCYGTRASGHIPGGTVVYSRLPITYVNRLDSEKLLVELLHEQQRLRLCCVHMGSYQFVDSDRAEIDRMRHGEVQRSSRRIVGKASRTILHHQTEWEQRLLPVVSGSSVPLVVAGDMNDIPGSWLYHQLGQHLHDAYREQGSGLGTTYLGGFPQFRIDMVFRSEGLRTLSYRRLRTRLSDHYPLLVALELDP